MLLVVAIGSIVMYYILDPRPKDVRIRHNVYKQAHKCFMDETLKIKGFCTALHYAVLHKKYKKYRKILPDPFFNIKDYVELYKYKPHTPYDRN